ncbi:HD domain-containing protein [Streptomyces cupreus]|uniref:HD domain-containing protein n=1 Tax=Streptomyces cupreus TaxID=2759956 RepID=A0A7X1JGE1_9ACTN|nr:HD domain-containing protein [Streptomyces cupreus]
MQKHHPCADTALIRRAHDEAAVWHEGQMRRSGDPVLTHCLAVATIVADVGMPPPVICAALLHDVGDTACPPGWLGDHFGQEIAGLVSAVRAAEFGALPPGLTRELAGPACRPTDEEAVWVIRLADRLHNMRTIEFVAPAKQHRKARDTLDILEPLARAAGWSDISRELRDLSTAVLQPASTAIVTTRLLAVLTVLLPGPTRGRWREEWHAELATLRARRARTRFAFRLLLSAPRLSWTLRRPADRDRRW